MSDLQQFITMMLKTVKNEDFLNILGDEVETIVLFKPVFEGGEEWSDVYFTFSEVDGSFLSMSAAKGNE